MVSLFFYLVLAVFGITFAALNASSIKINLYATTLAMPTVVLIGASILLGVFLGFFLFSYRYWHLKKENRKLKNQLELTEKEIKNLRSIPLHDQ